MLSTKRPWHIPFYLTGVCESRLVADVYTGPRLSAGQVYQIVAILKAK